MVILCWHIHKIQIKSIKKYMPTFLPIVVAAAHEQFGSQTNFPSKKVLDDERFLGLRTRKLTTTAS
jgi:hypothetical protein